MVSPLRPAGAAAQPGRSAAPALAGGGVGGGVGGAGEGFGRHGMRRAGITCGFLGRLSQALHD